MNKLSLFLTLCLLCLSVSLKIHVHQQLYVKQRASDYWWKISYTSLDSCIEQSFNKDLAILAARGRNPSETYKTTLRTSVSTSCGRIAQWAKDKFSSFKMCVDTYAGQGGIPTWDQNQRRQYSFNRNNQPIEEYCQKFINNFGI